MKLEVAVLGPPSLKVLMVGLCGRKAALNSGHTAQEVCESRGGHLGLPVPNSPCGLCERIATLNKAK